MKNLLIVNLLPSFPVLTDENVLLLCNNSNMKYFPLQNSFLEDLGFNPLPPGVAYLYPLITSENLSPETFNVF